MEQKKCVVCGFDKYVENHHIIKFSDYGSDEEENLVYLCPNHHWIADFGDIEDKKWIIEEIKKVSGKIGKKMNEEDLKKFKKKARRLVEESLGRYTDKEWKEKNMENTFNFECYIKDLRKRAFNGITSRNANKRAELLLLRDKIDDELKDYYY